MSVPSPGSGDSLIYPIGLGAEDAGREQDRADAIARIGAVDALGPATFFPPERLGGLDFEGAWRDWLSSVFEAWLGRKFVDVYQAAGRMECDRIAAIDLEIDERLGAEARRRGRAAALPYLEGRTEVRRQPQWVRYLEAQSAGELPGQLTTIFALQAALFHLPLLPALAAYVNLEGANGLAAMAGGRRLDPNAFSARYPQGLEAARRVFRPAWPAGDTGRENDNDDTPGHLACV